MEKIESKKNLLAAFTEGFKRIFDFKGRSGKLDFWGFALGNTIIVTLLNLLVYFAGKDIMLLNAIGLIYTLVSVIALIAVCVRRLHDLNLSGKLLWGIPALFILAVLMSVLASAGRGTSMEMVGQVLFILTGLAFFGLIIYVLILTLKRGHTEENSYGSPLAEDENDSRLANIYAVFYILLGIANRVYVYQEAIKELHPQTPAPAVVEQTEEPAAGQHGRPQVPMHNSVE